MSSSPGYMVSLIFFCLFALLLPDITSYAVNYVNANNTASAIVDAGQKYGVIDQQSVDQILTERNLQSDKWSVNFTESQVQYNESMTVQLRGKYEVKALYVIGKAFGESIPSHIPINVQREALGQVYRR